MHKSLWIVPVLLLFAIIGAPRVVRADDITYTVDLGTLVNGTITTDGTIGALNSSNIISFDLMVNDGTDPAATISTSDPYFSGSEQTMGENSFTATATDLSFDFTEPIGSFADLVMADGTTNYTLCYDQNLACDGVGSPIDGITVLNLSNDDSASVTESGTQLIASVATTPEPGTATLLLTGLGLLAGLMMRKRMGCGLAQSA